MYKVGKEYAERMQFTVRQLKKGRMSIRECETALDGIVMEVEASIMDVDLRIEMVRAIKRRAWRMLLEATK